ncbi:MAG: hypothetical protein AseanaTS_27090 [Candidatus Pelagadaptatus aseana]|uniref:hypothetical protein n=1 Tax=Candidatus Pelagadaptatus aseana TaxID=3120508 RepID=UPI0039B23A45
MLRYYYCSDSLRDIERVERELEHDGFPRRHIHVLSHNEPEMDRLHVHSVPSLLRSDSVHWAERGALVGLLVSAAVVAFLVLSGAHQAIGLPAVLLLAALVLGIFTWEAGLIGMQRKNYKLEQFEPILEKGQHVMLVDVDESEVYSLAKHMEAHPEVSCIGRGSSLINPFA